MKPRMFLLVTALAALGVSAPSAVGQVYNAIAYQGRLTEGGAPATGIFDFRFSIFASASGGSALAGPVTQSPVAVANGLFTVSLDFGSNVFTGSPRWLEIEVRRATNNPAAPYTLLSPRQLVSPVPTALHAQQADVAASVSGPIEFAQLPAGVARLDAPQTFVAPPFFMPASGPPFLVGNTQRVANLNADLLDGLDATAFWMRRVNGITEIIGPQERSNAFEIVLGTDRALRLQPGDANGGSSLVGGSANNSIVAGVPGSVIAGGRNNLINSGADYSVVTGGDGNQILTGARDSIIGGGASHRIGTDSIHAGVFAGSANEVMANSGSAGVLLGWNGKVRENSPFSAVVSGQDHSIGPDASSSVIVGGAANAIRPGAYLAFLGAGRQNLISTGAFFSVIVGGENNKTDNGAYHSALVGGINNAIGPASYGAFLGGGGANKIEATAPYSAILGGNLNVVRTNAGWATVLGGVESVAGAPFAIAAGHGAKALHSGSIVLADGQYANFASSNVNEFAVRAAGGVRFVTAGAGLFVDGQRLTNGGGGNLVIPAGAIATSNLANGAVTAPKVAANQLLKSLNGLRDDVTLTVGAGLTLSTSNQELRVEIDSGTVGSNCLNCYWELNGNAGTTAANFVGTTDDVPLTMRVNNSVGFRLLPDALFQGMNLHSPNVVGGSMANLLPDGNGGSVIAGGGTPGGADIGVPGVGPVEVGGGNIIHSSFANVDGGAGNIVRANGATIGGGSKNEVAESAILSVVSGGERNQVGTNAAFATIAGGRANEIFAYRHYGTVGGGWSNQVAASYATVPGGLEARATQYGQLAYAGGAFANAGDAQSSQFVLRGITTDASPRELFLDGDTQRLRLSDDSVWTFDILIVARSSGTSGAGYQIRGVIKHNALGLTTLIGTPVVTILGEQVAGWDVSVEADDVNDALAINVTGSATTVRWVASVRTVEVIF